MFCEDGLTTRLPMLDESDYPYLKARMRAFLNLVDEKVWFQLLLDGSIPKLMKNE